MYNIDKSKNIGIVDSNCVIIIRFSGVLHDITTFLVRAQYAGI
jgi:hypothetical protein